MNRGISILIADDTEIAREGVRRLLAGAPDIRVVDEASTIYEAVRKTRELRPHVLLIDLKWSGDDRAGAYAIEYLSRNSPQTKIIAITVYDELIPIARQKGAHLAITKDFSRTELQAQIRELHRSPSLPLPYEPCSEAPATEPLTEREMEVLTLLAEGMADRQIARELTIAENTAKTHVASILAKLRADNRTQAVIIALRTGILGIDSNREGDAKWE